MPPRLLLRPVVPALIASVAAQLVMGDVSVSAYQQSGRGFLLRGRLRLPVGSVLDAERVPPYAEREHR